MWINKLFQVNNKKKVYNNFLSWILFWAVNRINIIALPGKLDYNKLFYILFFYWSFFLIYLIFVWFFYYVIRVCIFNICFSTNELWVISQSLNIHKNLVYNQSLDCKVVNHIWSEDTTILILYFLLFLNVDVFFINPLTAASLYIVSVFQNLNNYVNLFILYYYL